MVRRQGVEMFVSNIYYSIRIWIIRKAWGVVLVDVYKSNGEKYVIEKWTLDVTWSPYLN